MQLQPTRWRSPSLAWRMLACLVAAALLAAALLSLWWTTKQLTDIAPPGVQALWLMDELRGAAHERDVAVMLAALAPGPAERIDAQARARAAQAAVATALRRLGDLPDARANGPLAALESAERSRAGKLMPWVAAAASAAGSAEVASGVDAARPGALSDALSTHAGWEQAFAAMHRVAQQQASRERADDLARLRSYEWAVGAAALLAALVAWASLRSVKASALRSRALMQTAGESDAKQNRAIAAERRLRDQITAALGDGVVIADMTPAGPSIFYVNDAMCAMTGYDREDFIGRDCRFLQGPQTDAEAAQRLAEALRARAPQTLEILNYRKDGSTFWNMLSVAPIADESGRATRMIGFQRDVTAVKARERERVIAQRLAALGELAGGVAHDFNNLLSAIVGMGDLLAERVRGQAELELPVRIIAQAAQRGTAQVRRLMNLSRAPVLSRVPVDLASMTQELVELLARTLPSGIELVVQVDEDARWLDAEPAQLESALLNLVLNASAAMPRGGRIRIDTRKVVEQGSHWVSLRVADNGKGMDEDTQARIFDPFFTTRASEGGNGLGLAMVHAYVHNLGGRICVRSTLGQGSTFELLLPAGTARAAAAPARVEVPRSASPCRALLVDDDEVVRITTRQMLERLGHRVVDCSNASAALDLLALDDGFDLLVTDYRLSGGLDGGELAVEARLACADLPVLACSGWTEAAPQALGAGAIDAFLPKPFSLGELADGIARAKRLRSARRTAMTADC